MITSLRARMGLLILAFFSLVSISVIATFWAIDTQKKDALVINLAGRQRMLIQQMTKDAIRMEKGRDEAYILALQDAARTFDQTLWTFINGGQAPYLPEQTAAVPATQQSQILASLHQIHHTWGTFRGYLETIIATDPQSPNFGSAVQAVEDLSPNLVRQADKVVRMYEAASAKKMTRLRWIQIAFFASALVLLAIDALLIQKLVVGPLRALGSVAERIGRGDLGTSVEVAGPQEIERLAHSFDTMRASLKTSQEALLTWTEELETRVAQRTRELAALHEVSREISSRLDIHHVLRSVTDKARELLGGEIAALCLLDEGDQALHLEALSGPREALGGARVSAQHPLTTQVLAGDRALPCGVGECTELCGIIAAPYRASHLAAPLRVGERAIGALCVGKAKAAAFSGKATDLLTKLADSAAIALENARLYQQTERVAALEERQRIAAEMHDGLAQTLSYLGLKVEQVGDLVQTGRGDVALEELNRLRESIGQASQQVRRAISSLRKDPQPRRSLQDRLAALVGELVEAGDPPVQLVIGLQTPLLLPPDESEQVLRVAQEALQNAYRHAQARQIVVRLKRQGDEAVVVVEDDGRGFDPTAPLADGSRHFGLSIMRARAASIGGQLAIHSAPGQGARVTMTWSVDERSTVRDGSAVVSD